MKNQKKSTFAQYCKEHLPVQQKTEMIANLKRNWYFPISAMAFFLITIDDSLGYCLGLPIAFGAMIVIASQIHSVWDAVNRYTFWNKILCFACAVGICLGNQAHFYGRVEKLIVKIDLPEVLYKVFLPVSYIGAACATFFVFFCVLIFCKEMKRIFAEVGDCTNRAERVVYGLLLVAMLGFVVVSFVQTDAFYGTDQLYDVIYTSDSPCLVKGKVYLALTQSENDLRQPLFAVFAAPFIGLPYLIARVFGNSATIEAVLVNSVQIVMLIIANLLLARMLKLSPLKRICFMLLTSCTYTYLLFTLMMEQYIVAYFWLMLCLFFLVEKKRPNRIAFWGAGGTMLTSMVLLPFMSEGLTTKNCKVWFRDTVKYGVEFVIFLLIFCRFDVFFNLASHFSFLSAFTGKTVTMANKVNQYTEFICNCFVSPDAGIHTAAAGQSSWQLDAVTGVNIWGVVIFLLAVVSAIWNRDKKSSRMAMAWVAFSVIMLLFLGWGTKENGLILYALYFGWAFLVLLFQLVEKIEEKLNIKYLIPIITACTVVVLLVNNIPAIMEMVKFAITYYPV